MILMNFNIFFGHDLKTETFVCYSGGQGKGEWELKLPTKLQYQVLPETRNSGNNIFVPQIVVYCRSVSLYFMVVYQFRVQTFPETFGHDN